MTVTSSAPTSRASIASREIGTGLWLLAPPGDLDAAAAPPLRAACVAALDRGGLNLVVDLTGARELSADALDVLVSVSETLLARGGRLWLAVAGTGHAYDVLPVGERGLEAAEGFHDALDAALAAERATAGGRRRAGRAPAPPPGSGA
ncbi:MAG TPA: STAS domain-containing protein [Gaiellaceae bacterium]|nr:STAS domain-containing protein [Gaiellaceae bacterium]